jgi:hypothetical protein
MVLEDVEVTIIASRLQPIVGSTMWLAGTRAPTHCGRNPNNSGIGEILPTLHVVPYEARE